ncbi:Uncharacterized protein APZ42_021281 [Daphnia magna]|uniref:Uncharacterized protein n=1 Tax=Daphnia magna TaxID=35525 RepID=A0A164WTA7_9CRUS|nr:Uncharacterized protein APZ42_021281 [Daphnia magna]
MTFALRMDQWFFSLFPLFLFSEPTRCGKQIFYSVLFFIQKNGTVWFNSFLVFLWSPA